MGKTTFKEKIMTFTSSLALFLALVVLALVPGPGVLAVTARSAAEGLKHGISITAGIVTGDFIFITLALLGLSALAEVMGGLFVVVKYIGAAYLVWLGLSLIFSKQPINKPTLSSASHTNSFLIGVITTISNPKAILFYLSFFPAFFDLATIAAIDAVILYILATVSVGSVMFGYAYIAHKAKKAYVGNGQGIALRAGSGSMLIGSGLYVASRG